MTGKQIQLLKIWTQQAYIAQKAHYLTADKLKVRHRIVGVLTLVLNLLVGTTIFITLTTQQNNNEVKIATGLASLFAAGLVGLQTFLRDSEQAEIHKKTAAHFVGFRREIEVMWAKNNTSDAEFEKLLEDFSSSWVQYIKECPTVGSKEFQKAHEFYNFKDVPSELLDSNEPNNLSEEEKPES